MARNAAALKSQTLLVPDKAVAPSSFVDALQTGWAIAKETTVISVDRKHRHGKVILHKKGSAGILEVDYTGSSKVGYQFSAPKYVYLGEVQ